MEVELVLLGCHDAGVEEVAAVEGVAEEQRRGSGDEVGAVGGEQIVVVWGCGCVEPEHEAQVLLGRGVDAGGDDAPAVGLAGEGGPYGVAGRGRETPQRGRCDTRPAAGVSWRRVLDAGICEARSTP